MKNPTTTEPTQEQLARAYAAVRENPHLLPALKLAGVDWATFALNAEGTLERLEAFKASRK